MTVQIAILGAGGFARELRWAVDHGATAAGERLETVAFVEPVARPEPLKGLPVLALDDVGPGVLLICGIGGMTEIKERVVTDALARGHAFAPAIIAAGAIVGPDVTMGVGTAVLAGSIVTTDVVIGDHVAVNLGCTIGHDAELGDYVTLSPGVRLSGGVVLGLGAFCGTGASVIEQVSLGAWSVLGAGAVATRDVAARALAVGVPAAIKKPDRFAR